MRKVVCNTPGCVTICVGPYCADCQSKRPKRRRSQRRPSPSRRGYGRAWQRIRAEVLAAEPICRICRRRPATDVDHIIRITRGGTNDRSNLQPLCKPCHSRKTARQDGGFGSSPAS